ncbi:MAG TPA: MFS transporter [Candidatus Limnocylindrales bacterium]|nr:MFS transporter [Candidatus Limnocylindrales bacterium]
MRLSDRDRAPASGPPTTPPGAASGRARERLALYATVFLAQTGSAAAAPILPDLRSVFGISAATVVLTTSIWGAARLVTDLPLGAATNRIRLDLLLVVGTILAAVGSIGCALSPNFGVLLAFRAVAGMGAAVISISAVVALIRVSEPNRRGRALGFYNAAVQAGSTLSPAVAGFAGAIWGWPAAFLVAGLGAIGGTGVYLFLSSRARGAGELLTPAAAAGPPQPEVQVVEGSSPDAGRRPLPGSRILFLSIDYATFALFFLTGAVMQTAIPLFGGSQLALGPGSIGLLLGGATALRFTISLIGAELSDRIGRRKILVPGLLTSSAFLAGFTLVGSVPTYVVATLGMAAGRVGNSMPIALLSDHASQDRMGRLIGINRFVADLGLVTGPLVAGILIDRSGYAVAFLACAVVAASAAAFIGLERVVARRSSAAGTGAA